MRVHIPSARNLEIYHFLEDDGDSIREVAHRFRVSPTRITQIHSQVDRWYRCSAPDPEMDHYRRQDAVASCKRHKVRAGRMYGRMEEAGGTFTNWAGEPTIHSGEGIGTNGLVLEEVLKVTRRFPR